MQNFIYSFWISFLFLKSSICSSIKDKQNVYIFKGHQLFKNTTNACIWSDRDRVHFPSSSPHRTVQAQYNTPQKQTNKPNQTNKKEHKSLLSIKHCLNFSNFFAYKQRFTMGNIWHSQKSLPQICTIQKEYSNSYTIITKFVSMCITGLRNAQA